MDNDTWIRLYACIIGCVIAGFCFQWGYCRGWSIAKKQAREGVFPASKSTIRPPNSVPPPKPKEKSGKTRFDAVDTMAIVLKHSGHKFMTEEEFTILETKYTEVRRLRQNLKHMTVAIEIARERKNPSGAWHEILDSFARTGGLLDEIFDHVLAFLEREKQKIITELTNF
jgi:hypothetical protein